jgi:multiple sugar transport system substrate-binding protein
MFGPFTSKWMFFQAFTSKGKFYFNDKMEPEINSKEGVEALQYLQDIVEFQMPGALSFDWGGVYGAMTAGGAYSTHTWVSFANYNNREGSKTRGKITAALMPGWDVKGTICHASPMADSWSYIVSKYSEYQELAYLWVQYNSSPEVSAKAILAMGGYFDPFRYSHFRDPDIIERYTTQVLDALLANTQVSFPDVILVGGAEYMDLLDKEVQAAVTGLKTAKKALDDAAEKWEDVTERYGREQQLEQWKWLKQFYPKSVKDAAARIG